MVTASAAWRQYLTVGRSSGVGCGLGGGPLRRARHWRKLRTRMQPEPPFAPGALAAAVIALSVAAIGCSDETTPPLPSGPITAEREVWTWVPFDDAFCADGNPTGLAVNLTDRSKNALIFLMGGGACWDYASCY